MTPAVQQAMAQPAASHRADAFQTMYHEVQSQLCALTGARHATLLLGSGTLANDAVAAQLGQLPGSGVVVANGEFGERLIDHAQRMQLRHVAVTSAWGAPLDWEAAARALRATNATWLWAVHSETSTGVVNDLDRLRALAAAQGARLAVDAISSVGAMPVALRDVWMASAVSGKALSSYAGVAIVLHANVPAPSPNISRYLDLGYATACGGIPFTQSSNLLAALHASLTETDWSARFAERAQWSGWLRNALEADGLTVVAPRALASPVIHTIALPPQVPAAAMGRALREAGWLVSFESDYLRERQWLQLCLMGALRGEQVRGVVYALRERLTPA
jgi:aspartate aminotransferase-like enzyme